MNEISSSLRRRGAVPYAGKPLHPLFEAQFDWPTP